MNDEPEEPPRPLSPRDESEPEAKQSTERPAARASESAGERPRFRSTQRPAAGTTTGGRREGRSSGRREEQAREETPSGERIAKRLARAGISSRREAESLIADGRVRVNGKVLASPAFNVQPGDRIELDGSAIPEPERTRLFLFHKPAGVVTTNRDPEGRKTLFEVLPEGLPRLVTVGRLDINTEGLLLLTNDGGLARVLELPATGWLRRYRVRVHGTVDEAKLKELREGVAVDGVFYGAIEAELERTQGSNAWLTLGLREGKNREVKNVLGSLGLEVNRLIRISYGPFQLGELEEGQVQEIKGRTLRDQLGERLIEEADADFEGDIRQPFSNRPTAKRDEPAAAASPRREARPEPGEGGLIKNRKRERERFRADGLDRLSTRPNRAPGFGGKGPMAGEPAVGGPMGKGPGARSFGAKPEGFKTGGFKAGGFKAGANKRRDELEERQPPRSRAANVWMAPGARPLGKEKAAAAPRPDRDPNKPRGSRTFREAGGERSWQPRGEQGGEPRGGKREQRQDAQALGQGESRQSRPREHREGSESRPAREEFRSRPPRNDEGGGERRQGRPRFEGEGRFGGEDRPPRREGGEARPRRAEAQDRRSQGRGLEQGAEQERPRESRDGMERPFRERTSGEAKPRSFGGEAKPRGERPFRQGSRPEGGEKTFNKGPRPGPSDRPFNKRSEPAGDRPPRREGKPGGFRPSGGKPAGAPRGERPNGGKPGGSRPGGGKPGGGKPGGGKRPFNPRGDR